MGYCIPYAIQLRLKIKELAELLSGKTGRNSLTLKKLLGGIFHEASGPKLRSHHPNLKKPPTPNLRSLRPKIYYVAAIAHAPYAKTTIQKP
jgi:hypothetical protein